LGGALARAEGLPPETSAALVETARGAFTEAIVVTASVSTLLALVAAIGTATLLRGAGSGGMPAESANV
jgi:hypothetical protein